MKRQKIKGVEKMKNNGNIDSVFERYRSHGMTDGTEGFLTTTFGNDRRAEAKRCPTKAFGHDRRYGFTLVELVIVIAIVIILSVISVPIYRGYVDKAKIAEGYALLGSILSAQKAYYSEHGNFLLFKDSNGYTCNEPVMGIDARGNKYFTQFYAGPSDWVNAKIQFYCGAKKPKDLAGSDNRGNTWITLHYDMNSGIYYTTEDTW